MIPELGRSPGEGKATHSSILENSVDFIVHGVAKSLTWLSNFHFHPHKVSQEEFPGFLFSGRDWGDGFIEIYIYGFPGDSVKESTCQCRKSRRYGFEPWVRKIPWGMKCQPTPVFLPGKPHRQRNLVGYSPWGCQRVGCDWASQVVLVINNLLANAADIKRHGFYPWVEKIPWRRQWWATLVSLPEESHGQRSLATVYGVAKSG